MSITWWNCLAYYLEHSLILSWHPVCHQDTLWTRYHGRSSRTELNWTERDLSRKVVGVRGGLHFQWQPRFAVADAVAKDDWKIFACIFCYRVCRVWQRCICRRLPDRLIRPRLPKWPLHRPLVWQTICRKIRKLFITLPRYFFRFLNFFSDIKAGKFIDTLVL